MVTLAQRIEALRTESGRSRVQLASALGFPKGSIDKFETGRQTPSREQQQKLADFFGVSLFYLRGESNDRTRQEDWLEHIPDDDVGHVPMAAPTPKVSRPKAAEVPQTSLLESLLSGKQAQDTLRAVLLEVLRSPDGQALIAKAVQKELSKHR